MYMYVFFRYKQPPLDYDLIQYTQYDKLEVFDKVATWDFPIFELEDKASDQILSHVRILCTLQKIQIFMTNIAAIPSP